jgi:hypothetical protein
LQSTQKSEFDERAKILAESAKELELGKFELDRLVKIQSQQEPALKDSD